MLSHSFNNSTKSMTASISSSFSDGHFHYSRCTPNYSSRQTSLSRDQEQRYYHFNSCSPPTQSSYYNAPRSDNGSPGDDDISLIPEQKQIFTWSTEKFIHILTEYVEQLCLFNKLNGAPRVIDQYWRFFSRTKEEIELQPYISRLVHYSYCSTSAFVVMTIYIDRIEKKCNQLLVTDRNCHRLLCTSLVLAIKYLEDNVYANKYYAAVGGVRPEEMNELEVELLSILDWNLSVSLETFSAYERAFHRFASVLNENSHHDLRHEHVSKKRKL